MGPGSGGMGGGGQFGGRGFGGSPPIRPPMGGFPGDSSSGVVGPRPGGSPPIFQPMPSGGSTVPPMGGVPSAPGPDMRGGSPPILAPGAGPSAPPMGGGMQQGAPGMDVRPRGPGGSDPFYPGPMGGSDPSGGMSKGAPPIRPPDMGPAGKPGMAPPIRPPTMPLGQPPQYSGMAPVNGAPATSGMSSSADAQAKMMKRANVKPLPQPRMPPKPNA